MEQVKGQIYELMGIADIQRGQTDPTETLGAQIIKSNNNKKSFKQFESIQKLLNAENKLERIMARLAFSNAKAIDIKHKIQ